jgi:predicted GNAT family acetyltransferase
MVDAARFDVEDNPAEHRFEVRDETGAVAGFAAYQRASGRVVFTHTVVDEAFEGQGVGSTLVRRALDAVREEGSRVEPRCPFVRAFVQRHREYGDLVA